MFGKSHLQSLDNLQVVYAMTYMACVSWGRFRERGSSLSSSL